MNSIFIAKLMGPTLIAVGISALVNPNLIRDMGKEVLDSTAFVFIAGFGALILGLAIVNTHNVWSGWPVIITVIGWLAVIAGVVRLILPEVAKTLGRGMLEKAALLRVVAVADIAIGGILAFQGYTG